MSEEEATALGEAQKEVLRLMTEGALTPRRIANLRDTSVQAVYKSLRKLEAKGLIKRVGTGVWNICEDKIKPPLTTGTTKGFNQQEIIDLHALEIDMPIIRGRLDLIKDFDGYATEGMRGWTPEYSKFKGPIGFTLRNNNNKSVSIFIYSREIPRSYDIHKLARNTVWYVAKLMEEKDVILDVLGASTKNLNISVSNKDLDRVFNKGEIFKVKLGRATEKIFPKDTDKQAEAWVDSSPRLGVETNDLKYKENLLMVPERVERIDRMQETLAKGLNPSIDRLAREMNTHTDIMEGIRDGINAFNKTVDNFTPKQTVLRLWSAKKKKRAKKEVPKENVSLTEFWGGEK